MQKNNHRPLFIIRWLAGLRDFVAAQTDIHAFACRVELASQLNNGQEIDAFDVQMRGRIRTPTDNYDTDVQVRIQDITEGRMQPLAVLCTDSRWQRAEEPVFSLKTHNGIVPRRNAVLGKWKTISQIGIDVLRFPHRGQRRLLFEVGVLSSADGNVLVKAPEVFDYFVGQDEGYIDFRERQKRILGACVTLAVAAAAFKAESEHKSLLADWISREGKGVIGGLEEFNRELEGLNESRPANEEKTEQACRTLSEKASADVRLKAAELCLRMAAVSAPATPEQVEFVWGLGNRLQIQPDRMRMLLDKLLPLHLQQRPNLEIMLGIRADMDEEEVRRLLTSEYRKWNARVNHPDEVVRQQADMMLSFLADARSGYAAASAEL